ncbi:MFS transporter [Kribbella catacumbae]|uniref:MFS transporter n=1 Tax=Kribbella catacumbae TaxID=460086 RepID=UPI00037AE737|nr:MFS transporter [Kribbella catacumbae]
MSSIMSKVADYGLLLIAPLAVLAATGSVASSIFTVALRGVAYAGSPLIGSMIDRFDRRTVYFASQVQQGTCIAVAAVFLDQQLVVALMLLLSGFGGVASTITGQFVLIPQLVSSERRTEAVASVASAIEFAKVAGFLGAGAALTAVRPGISAGLVAATYFAAGLISLLLPTVRLQRDRSGVWADLKIGFAWLAKPDIAWLVTTMAVSNLALGGLGSVLVTTMGDDGAEPLTISVTLTLGLLLGAFGAKLAPRTLAGWSLRQRILVFQVAAGIGFAVITLELGHWVLIAAYAVMSYALGLSNVVSISFRQDVIPLPLAGRVNSVIRMFIAGANPLSGLIYAFAVKNQLWIWLPALVLEIASLLIWAAYTMMNRNEHEDVSQPSQ